MFTSVRPLVSLSSIFLCDIIWSAKYEEIRPTIDSTPELIERVSPFLELQGTATTSSSSSSKLTKELPVELVCEQLWKVFGSVEIESEQGKENLFFLLAEAALGMQHSGEAPNVRLEVMVNPETGMPFAVFWPVRDIAKGEEIARDFLARGAKDKSVKALCGAVVFAPQNLLDQTSFVKAYEGNLAMREVDEEKFREAAELHLEKAIGLSAPNLTLPLVLQAPVKVYIENPAIKGFLTRPEFVQVESPEEAQVLWPMQSISHFKRTPTQLVNQFPFEASLVNKGHLAKTVKKVFGGRCPWLPTSYDLDQELSYFLGDYFRRRQAGEDNTWILKPVALARSMDISVTQSLPCVIRHMELGERVVCKYIHQPALFNGRKFDMRYTVLVRSFEPLDLFVAAEKYVRVANQEFSLDHFEEFEKHFTCMTYVNPASNYMWKFSDFISEFQKHSGVVWEDVDRRVHEMLKRAFSAAAVQYRMTDPQARAIYGVDVMLTSELQPQLLEVTYCPDLRVVTKVQPSFVNDAFGCLFLDQTEGVIRI